MAVIARVVLEGVTRDQYDAVRAAPDPKRAILDFLESTYDACATRLGWSPDLLRQREP